MKGVIERTSWGGSNGRSLIVVTKELWNSLPKAAGLDMSPDEAACGLETTIRPNSDVRCDAGEHSYTKDFVIFEGKTYLQKYKEHLWDNSGREEFLLEEAVI